MIIDHSLSTDLGRSPAYGRFPRGRRGFALLITITLLAFLVLLLVSLASLTRVETQVASNSQQLAQARQNALMALNIALGQLQKFTGPDQRTTARADMDAALANVTDRNGRWLAAYGNGAPIDTTYTLKPSQIPAGIKANSDSKGSQAKLLNWLVSGNEGTVFDPSSTATVGTDGHIVAAPTNFAYTPASTIDLKTASATPVISATQALLVGPNSATASSDFVAAPLVPINAAAGTVPGFNGAAPIGRYAWWVGDEGAKARVNLPMASAAQAPAAFVSAQRAAIELVDGKNEVGETNATDLIGTTAYDPTLDTLPRLVSPGQLGLLTPTAATTLPTALKLRFHDLTASSTSVLADNYAGGLKKDLSAVLANKAAADVGAGEFRPLDTAYLFTPENNVATDAFGVPTWGQLRSAVQTKSSAGVLPDSRLATSTSVGPISGVPTSVGIAPVLTYISLGCKYVAPNGVADGEPIRLAVFPMVILWNPYTSTLPQHTFEVGIVRRGGSMSTTLEVEAPDPDPAKSQWSTKELISLNKNLDVKTANGSAAKVSTYIRFKVELPPEGIPPGASLVFTLPTSGAAYDTPHDKTPVHTLTNGLNANGFVLAGSGTLSAGESTKKFRVSGMTQGGLGFCAYLGEVTATGTVGDASYLKDDKDNYRWHQFISQLSPGAVGGVIPDPHWDGGTAGLDASLFFDKPAPGNSVLYPSAALTADIQMSFGYLPNTQINYPNVRWIAQTNPRASIIVGIPSIFNAPAYEQYNSVNYASSSGRQNWPLPKLDPGGKRASSGVSIDSASAIVDTTLFEFRSDTQPLLGIGQLQQANLSLINSYPAYAVGNSLADFRFLGKRDQVLVSYTMTVGVDNPPTTKQTSYYDISWLLNRVLWDRYFVSSVPNKGTGTTYAGSPDLSVTASTSVPDLLPNPRHVKYGTADAVDLHDADKAAANLLLKGGFNINSTSEQAWRAVLGGINRLAYIPESGSTATATKLQAALPRFSKPTTPANTTSAPWQGYRALDEAQIALLAANIVAEIRNRGPFVSMADFVNRRLVDSTASTSAIDERIKGAIQAALDKPALERKPDSDAPSSADETNQTTTPFDDKPVYPISGSPPKSYAVAYDKELMQGGTTSVAPISSRAVFAPQNVTQADVLSAIGGGLSARSDTFTIRTYGEVQNPATSEISGRAWCEAVVQRLPEYINDAATSSAVGDPAVTSPASLQNPDNKKFGRRYKIISFRWLSSNDI